jgi:hypothetical protein
VTVVKKSLILPSVPIAPLPTYVKDDSIESGQVRQARCVEIKLRDDSLTGLSEKSLTALEKTKAHTYTDAKCQYRLTQMVLAFTMSPPN